MNNIDRDIKRIIKTKIDCCVFKRGVIRIDDMIVDNIINSKKANIKKYIIFFPPDFNIDLYGFYLRRLS